MPEQIEINFDVTRETDLGAAAVISGTLFIPRHDRVRHSIVLLLPGGGFTRSYYDFQIEGHEGYSPATQLVERGWTVFAMDNLGTGNSTIPQDGRRVTLDRCARAASSVARQLRARASAGTLCRSLPARKNSVVGIGHSLGGCIVTLAQGNDPSCDAVGILGFSCRYIKGSVDPATGERLRRREPSGSGYNRTTPTLHRESFYTGSVPRASWRHRRQTAFRSPTA